MTNPATPNPVDPRCGSTWCTALVMAMVAAGLLPGASGPARAQAGTSAGVVLPSGGQVVNGSASIAVQGNRMTVTHSADAILNWQSFSVGAGASVRFDQPGAGSRVLNRVVGNDVSSIAGSISSNGTVWLLNPYGVWFGAGARVDVGGLVASTLSLSDADWKARRYNLFAEPGGPPGGRVVNEGKLHAASGGRVLLVGNGRGGVLNSGLVEAPGGQAALLAGDKITLVDSGNPFLGVQVQVPAGTVTQAGQLLAAGGRIDLQAAMVNQHGLVSADGLALGPGGQVMITASHTATLAAGSRTSADGGRGGTVVVQAANNHLSGSISAQGLAGPGTPDVASGAPATPSSETDTSTGGGTGGTVHLLGRHVGLFGQASVDVSGPRGGGRVAVGGGVRGQDASLPNASAVFMGPQARIRADATDAGPGGNIVLWSDEATRAYGSLSARGGPNGGDGGFVETSGGWLDARPASVSVGAPKGRAGTWLLDPYDITLSLAAPPGADTLVDVVDLPTEQVWTSNQAPTTLYAENFLSFLADGNLRIETGPGGTGTGTITVTDGSFSNLGASPAFSLTLKAADSITFASNANLSIAGDVNLLAGSAVSFGTNATLSSANKATIAADRISLASGAKVSGGTGVELRGTTGNVKTIALPSAPAASAPSAAPDGPAVSSSGGPVLIYVTDPAGSPNTVLGNVVPGRTYTGLYPTSTASALPVAPPSAAPNPADTVLFVAPATSAIAATPAPTPAEPAGTPTVELIPPAPPVVLNKQETPDTFTAIDIANTPPAVVSERLAARDLHMQRVLSGAMTRLNGEPRLASLPDCSTPQQAAQGTCLVTEAMVEPLRLYLNGEVERVLRAADQTSLARVAGTPDCTGLDDALKGGCLVTDKLKLELRALLAARDGAGRNAASARAPIPQIKRKWAIVIGINDYVPAIPRLVNAQLDAHNLRDVLQRRFGYEVSLVLNGRKADIIAAFNRVAAQAQADDSLLVYYAGHGAVASKSNEGYWVPSDARADDPASFISNSDILSLLNRMAPRQLALISDSCFSGSLIASDADRFRGRSSVSDPQEVLDKRAAVVMTAGRNEPVADADKNGRSVFATSLIKALEGVNGWFAGDRVFQDVARQIARSLEGQRALYAGLSKARHQHGADYLFETRVLEVPK